MNNNEPIEITKVANGYMVRPAFDGGRRELVTAESSIYVFETYDALSKWVEKHFTEPSSYKVDGYAIGKTQEIK